MRVSKTQKDAGTTPAFFCVFFGGFDKNEYLRTSIDCER